MKSFFKEKVVNVVYTHQIGYNVVVAFNMSANCDDLHCCETHVH